MSAREFESILGEDLHGLALEQGPGLVGVVSLASATRAPKSGMAYRLDFADGASLKGRRLLDDAHARWIEYWIGALEDPMLPKVRGRRGAALLLDWVVGRSPGAAAGFDPDVHAACADFQARLHLWRDPELEARPPRFSIEELAARLVEGSAALEAQGLLSAGEAGAVRCIAEKPPPRAITPVLVHDDLCGENLVVDRRGRVRVIDNEGLRVGYGACDLARTVYRWEMDGPTEERFVARYEETASAEAFTSQRQFWLSVVLVESTRYRASAPLDHQQVPLARLRRELSLA